MTDHPVFEVLTVCRANVCRSPTAQALLRAQVSDLGLTEAIAVSSAGVAVPGPAAWCGQGQQFAGSAAREMSGRRARAVTAPVVAAADLVLTMSTEQRGRIVRILPAAARRTFLLVEAAHLADAIATHLIDRHDTRGLSVAPLPQSGDPVERLRWLVVEMNEARGLVRMPEPEVRGRWHTHRHGGVEIADPHGDERVHHSTVFGEIKSAVTTITHAMGVIVAA